MAAYYNEIDPYAAQWLRNLIAAGHIAPGDVDERSIVDVPWRYLRRYEQCHFFAGIGGWSIALRLAGWPDDRPVWTGSCPCQPFSAAGAGKAADDKRHLWPSWFPLIAELRPAVVFGEQVEAAIGWGWLDAVFADLEAAGYACGTAILPACGVGAPHIRQRAWFVADANGRNAVTEWLQRGREHGQQPQDGGASVLAHADSSRQRARRPSETGNGRDAPRIEPTGLRAIGVVADTASRGFREFRDAAQPRDSGHTDSGFVAGELGNTDQSRLQGRRLDFGKHPSQCATRQTSPWSDCEWLECTDGKARPVEPGTFPLAHGIQRRPSKLRAYGNAIVPQVAAEFISAADEAMKAVTPTLRGEQ